MGRSLLTGVLLVAACGRMDFDAKPAELPAPDVHALACGAQARFALGAGLESLSAVATPAGFAVVGVDGGQRLRGWTYEWAEEALGASAQAVPLGEGVTTTTGAAVVDGEIVVASIYGGATPVGTRLQALGVDLLARAPESARVGMMVGDSPIASCGDGSELALVSVDATDRVDARLIDTSGADLAPAKLLVDPAESASSVWLAPAKEGYLLSWIATAGSPNVKRLARFDRNLDRVAGPVTSVSGSNENVIRGAAAWLPGADRYLTTWFEKTSTGRDDVWFQIFDGALGPVTPPTRLATNAVLPQIGTDGARFYVAWRDVSGAPVLAAAAIEPDGAITPRPVASSGGAPLGHSFVERNGQAVLVWSEEGGTGPDLWLEPMCP